MHLYVLVCWPDSQQYMEEEWFEEHAILEVNAEFGPQAYFIPKDYYDEFHSK